MDVNSLCLLFSIIRLVLRSFLFFFFFVFVHFSFPTSTLT